MKNIFIIVLSFISVANEVKNANKTVKIIINISAALAMIISIRKLFKAKNTFSKELN